jgi:uncharacterized protein (TIGR03032 family)
MSETEESVAIETKPKPALRCREQGNFAEWLARSGGSLAVTTYTSGKLVLVSSRGDRLRFRTLRFPRPMGLALSGRRLALAVQQRILLFQRTETDAVFLPHQEFVTGKLDTHDVAFGLRGLYFVNTRWNCLARATTRCRFVRTWQPPFIANMVRRDRCHLNGLGMQDGRPALATAFCETNHAGGWREANRFSSGVLIDVAHNKVVARGLCMPHSPRRHRRRWWFCNSGHGTLETFDPHTGRCEEVCALSGFTRGLCFVGNHALVGLSKIRPEHILDAPPVHGRHSQTRAGVALVNLVTGSRTGLLEFAHGGNEVYEVLFLPQVKRPELIPFAEPRPSS